MAAVGFNLPTIDAQSSPIFEISGCYSPEVIWRSGEHERRRNVLFHRHGRQVPGSPRMSTGTTIMAESVKLDFDDHGTNVYDYTMTNIVFLEEAPQARVKTNWFDI